ncbi:MAG: hypothetical protein C0453_02280 [Comamonadaceae bacterium]|nr:hypothetical protein [Comamonadaceae bacterium]
MNAKRIAWRIALWIVGLLFAAAATLGAAVAYEVYAYHFPRVWMGMGLMGFDTAKAKTLSAEQRAAYEHELFEELPLWNHGSKRFPDGPDLKSFQETRCARDDRWKAMAQEGFELAHVARRAYNPCRNLVFSFKGPLKRLQTMAEQGNVGAMCMMGALRDGRQDLSGFDEVTRKMLETGAAKGHPECLWRMAQWTYPGIGGDKGVLESSLSMAARAASAGAYRAAVHLASHFRGLSRVDLRYVERAYCWSVIHDQGASIDSGATMVFQTYLVSARADGNPALESRLVALKADSHDAQSCIALGWH